MKTIDAIISIDGKTVAVQATVGDATLNEPDGDYSCEISCPPILRTSKRIIGADEEQAVELAHNFIVALLRSRGGTDSGGNPI
jgi:hypothetical protein